jgi:hypothetical protein
MALTVHYSSYDSVLSLHKNLIKLSKFSTIPIQSPLLNSDNQFLLYYIAIKYCNVHACACARTHAHTYKTHSGNDHLNAENTCNKIEHGRVQ